MSVQRADVEIRSLRDALAMLRQEPGQLVETDVEVDPEAELSGVYRYVGAGGTVQRPTAVDGPAMLFHSVKGFSDASVVIGVLAIRIMIRLLEKTLEKSHLEKAAHSLITSLSKAALYILLGLIAASALGIDVSSIVALASVLTLALSLALQNMVSNVIGGFTILYTHPFHSGDFVEIAGQSGTVQEINMTYTMLATADNKLVSLPNSAVVAAQVVNYTSLGTRRVEINVSAGYDAPTQKVIDALVLARGEAKKAKNFAEADRIRDELKARGIEIIDTPQGAKWRRV